MALFKRGDFYHYHFWVNGKRYRGSTKKTTMAAARQVESRLMAAAEENGDLAARKRSPILREFQLRFFDWADKSKLAEKSKKLLQEWLATAGRDRSGIHEAQRNQQG